MTLDGVFIWVCNDKNTIILVQCRKYLTFEIFLHYGTDLTSKEKIRSPKPKIKKYRKNHHLTWVLVSCTNHSQLCFCRNQFVFGVDQERIHLFQVHESVYRWS